MENDGPIVALELSPHTEAHRLYLTDVTTGRILRPVHLTKVKAGEYRVTLDTSLDTGKNVIGYVKAHEPERLVKPGDIATQWYAQLPYGRSPLMPGIRHAAEFVAASWYQTEYNMEQARHERASEKN